jgi:hypothetical protein
VINGTPVSRSRSNAFRLRLGANCCEEALGVVTCLWILLALPLAASTTESMKTGPPYPTGLLALTRKVLFKLCLLRLQNFHSWF